MKAKEQKNMLDRKQENKAKLIPDLQKKIAEIYIGNGRTSEPFIKVFQYNEENITKSSLGSLIGVFEIAEKSEDSTYIVNFLASVAKKEYFNNGRRGSIESFETSLHKINLALAELVKNGNIAWLGRLHGAIGVLEKNNLHFSVTGDAKIFLFRNGNLSEISEGIASTESSAHPIKTFIEISSGRLLTNDKIIFTSPELCELLTVEDIEKNAKRMDNDHFSRFLRTVLVNQVETGGTLVIDLSESPPMVEKSKKDKKRDEDTTNVFSEGTFIKQDNESDKKLKPNTPTTRREIQEEYIDRKTGHIFIQGETSVHFTENIFSEKTKMMIQDGFYDLRSFTLTQYRTFSKGGRKIISVIHIFLENTFFSIRRIVSLILRRIKQNLRKKCPSIPFLSISKKQTSEELSQENHLSTASLNFFLDSKRKIQALFSWLQKMTMIPLSWLFRSVFSFFKSPTLPTLSKLLSCYKKRAFIFGGIFVSLLSLSILLFFFNTKDTPSDVIEEPPHIVPTFPTDKEKNSSVLSSPLTTITTLSDTILLSFILNNEIYAVTDTYLFRVSDQKKYILPSENGTLRFASVMDDLGIVFLYTSENSLFSFSPTNNTFTRNSLVLPAQINVGGIGTYLTYLYILDENSKQIYRFPRADGGFGGGISWLKDAISFSPVSHIAVSENIFITEEQDIAVLFRGHFIKNCESTTIPLSPTSLFTKPNFRFIYVLDTKNQRVVIFDQSGTLIAQYFSEQFSRAKSISVNEETHKIFLTASNELFSFVFNPEQ